MAFDGERDEQFKEVSSWVFGLVIHVDAGCIQNDSRSSCKEDG